MNIFIRIKNRFTRIIKYLHRFGLIPGTNIAFALLNPFLRNGVIEISLPDLKYPLKIRNYTSDIDIFEQIFLDEDYNFPITTRPKLIIDGGAYVGYSSIYFADRFPEAKIIAIEPESSNFTLLQENTLNYQNIELINSGIWYRPAYLNVVDAGVGQWGFIVREVSSLQGSSFAAVTIEDLLKKSGYDEIDILKLDIEGSENELFSNYFANWLDKVNILIIELHDRLKSGCSDAFFSAIKDYNFTNQQGGENIILMRK